jgi:serine protease Do
MRRPRNLLPCLLVLLVLTGPSGLHAQPRSSTSLPANRFRNGEETLRAFAPVSQATRHSVVKFNVNGETVALGTVVDAQGLVLTKASELKPGTLTCWLASDQEVRASILATNEDLDLALVRVQAQGLKPVRWASSPPVVGQWAVTVGIPPTPHAVGVISALPRRVRPERALIGVQFQNGGSAPRIEEVLAGFGAEKAGLRPGDIIVAINGEQVSDRQQVVEVLRDFREGQTVKLRVQRAGDQFDAQVQLMVAGGERLGRGSFSQERASRLLGAVSQRAAGFEEVLEHDTVLSPWLCGGPLVDLDGNVIGLNIARAARVSTYALPPRIVQDALRRFLASAQW